MTKSYVYLIENGSEYKIGKSDNPKLRLATLQVGCTNKLKLLYLLEYENSELALLAEEKLHKLFHASSIRGEWFRLIDKDISMFKSFGICITIHLSQFEYYILGIDFIDAFAAMSKREQAITKLIKDCIKWDPTINSFNYLVELSPDSIHFNESATDSMPYNTFLKGFGLLAKKDLVRRIKRNHYMFNPDFFIPSGEQSHYFELLWAQSKQCK